MIWDDSGQLRAGRDTERGFSGVVIDRDGFHLWRNGRELVGHMRRLMMYRRRYERRKK
jgi:Ni/Co efflux regulator RcnB